MGWTCMTRNGRAVKEILTEACRPYKVLDIAIVRVRTAYIAMESPHGGVVALVFLLQFNRSDHYDFCYKDMDESMGPVECDCPERILRLLTAEPTGYAKEWREKCWRKINNKNRLMSGAAFRLSSPIRFSDGVERQRFRHQKYNNFICLDTATLVTIRNSNLNNITFE